MLGKLIKYELKESARWTLPVYAALLVMSIVTRLLMMITAENVWVGLTQGIAIVMFVLLVVGVPILTVVLIIFRFYKNLLTDQGYLMFTLPVKTWQHIVAKLVGALVWIVATMLVVGLALMFIFTEGAFFASINFSEFGPVYQKIIQEGLGFAFYGVIFGCILGVILSVLHCYTAIAIGQLANQHRVLSAVGAYVGINIVLEVVVMILVAAPGQYVAQCFDTASMATAVGLGNSIVGCVLVFECVLCAAFFFIINYIFNRHLNLE